MIGKAKSPLLNPNKVGGLNYDTKHLVGTVEEAPEFYRYWED